MVVIFAVVFIESCASSTSEETNSIGIYDICQANELQCFRCERV